LAGKGDREMKTGERSDSFNHERPLEMDENLQLFLLVLVEVTEIFLILIPLSLTGHILEAAAAGLSGMTVSISAALILTRSLQRLLQSYVTREKVFRYLKLSSGSVMTILSLILYYEA
jgi:hypothetical protein